MTNDDAQEAASDFAYDKMPYPGVADIEAHPRQLEALAMFFGMQPAPLVNARILEIGCAAGKHLLPIAIDYPEASLIGADLSVEQIAEAQKMANELELTNVEFRHANLVEIDDSWGKFDYILCPGVFSWVEPELQRRILQICRHNLAPQGVAVVSYNTFPGWHFYRVARDAMRYHAMQFPDPEQQVSEARGALSFFAANSPATTMQGQLYKNRAEFLHRSTDTYLYHDYLVNDNWPLYFHEFMEQANSNKLQFVSETNYAHMTSAFFPASARQELSKLSLLHREQILDFLRNQAYRKTILCHRDVTLNRSVDLSTIEKFQLTLVQVPEPRDFEVADNQTVTFRFRQGSFSTGSPFGKAALRCLVDRFPCSISLDELLAASLEILPPHLQPETIDGKSPREVLALSMVATMNAGLLQVYRHAPCIAAGISSKPKANPLARWDAQQGEKVTNQRHEVLRLDPSVRIVLSLLDGSRDVAAVEAALADRADRDTAKDSATDKATNESAGLLDQATIEQTLAALYRHSLLLA